MSRHSLKRRRKGFACHHLNPFRYIVRGASHQPHSAWQARPRRDRQEHAGYSPDRLTICKYTQMCDIVSHHNVKLRDGKKNGTSLRTRLIKNYAKTQAALFLPSLPACGYVAFFIELNPSFTFLPTPLIVVDPLQGDLDPLETNQPLSCGDFDSF